MTSSDYDNGVNESRTYNVDNTPSAITFTGASIGNLSYTWDDNHNKTSETISGTMNGYGFTASYDAEDRLTGWDRADANLDQSWDLTPVGDWQSFTENSVVQNRTHGPAHELTAAAGQAVQHDAKGNITLLPSPLRPQVSNFLWDFDNRLKSADVGNNGSVDVQYQFDALGRRVSRTASGSTTVFVQNNQQTLADYASGASPSSPDYTYIWGDYIDELVVRDGTGGRRFYHRNAQYSIVALTNASGTITERYAYDAYGDLTITDASGAIRSTSADDNRYAYTGREWDSTLELYHYRARMYDPTAGRFVGRDPIGFEGSAWNLHEYVGGNPLGRLDPDGTDFKQYCKCVGITLAAEAGLAACLAGNVVMAVACSEFCATLNAPMCAVCINLYLSGAAGGGGVCRPFLDAVDWGSMEGCW
jgi:RHS repeat-associated protein